MKWKLSLPEPPMAVYYLVKSIGLAPFTMANNKLCPPKHSDVLYPIFVAVTYSVLTLLALIPGLKNLVKIEYSISTRLWILIHHLSNFPSIFFTLIGFVFMREKILYIANQLAVVKAEFKSLGVQVDDGTIFKNFLTKVAISNTLVIAKCIILLYTGTTIMPIYIGIENFFENFFVLSTVVIFTQLLLCIGQRFTLLNQKFREMVLPTKNIGAPQDLEMHMGSIDTNSQALEDIQRVLKIEGLHLALCDLVNQTTTLFTISIIFISLQCLSSIGLTSFKIYLCSISEEFDDIVITRLLNNILDGTISAVQLFAIAHASATTSAEKNGIQSTLSEVWDATTSHDLHNELFTFFLQLKHESDSVNILGFLNLDYSYVFKIFCAIAAYLIIMVQFDQS